MTSCRPENISTKAWFNREGGDKRAVAACLTSLAVLALFLEKPEAAARLYGVVESQLESLSTNLLKIDQPELERIRRELNNRLDEATFTAAFTEGWEMREEQAIELVEEILGEEE